VQTLGNLSLLNKYANPAASNGPFNLKLAEYGHSVLRLNRYFDKVEQWDEVAIGKRSRELAELFCRLYPRPAAEGEDVSII
ncbi:MAG: HNH endonuclease, partial [Oxalobacteraceae bacterium]